MGRESSHGTKELFNLPLLVLKARHLSGSAFCTGFSRLKVPEQALDGIPLGLGSVVKINLLNFHGLSLVPRPHSLTRKRVW